MVRQSGAVWIYALAEVDTGAHQQSDAPSPSWRPLQPSGGLGNKPKICCALSSQLNF